MYPQMSLLCYCASLRAAARKATVLYDETLAPAGINVAQYQLLRRIEGLRAPSLTELARRAKLDRSTVGRNVRVLERMGLVRFAPTEDQREAAAALTPAGVEALRLAGPLWAVAQRRIEETLGAAGAETLQTLARRL
jgi:DNA-binding MarR family transcriptional regulator